MTPDTLNHLTAVATIAAAVLAALSTVVSYIVLRTATDPDVIVYSEQDAAEPRFLYIVIQNIGKGLAKDVRFQLSGKLHHEIVWRPKELNEGAFASGIPALPPGGRRVFIWGDFRSVMSHLSGESITCRISFKGRHVFLPQEIEFTNECVLEAESYRNTLDRRPDHGTEEIRRAIETVSEGLKPLPELVVCAQRIDRQLGDIKRMR